MERCLRKDPRRRWRDIGDVQVALEEGVPVVQVTDASPSRLPWTLSAALALALAGLAAPQYGVVPIPPSSPEYGPLLADMVMVTLIPES